MSAKKRRKKTKESGRGCDSYCLEVLDWELPYSFSLNKDKRFGDGAYSEHLTLELRGKILNPGKFLGCEVRVTLLGQREIENAVKNPDKGLDYEPRCLGAITLRGEQRDFLGWLPFDAAVFAGNLLAHGHYRYLVLSGQTLYRGKAEIDSMRFYKEFTSEDWF